jgi:2,3-bisphosphoglycerate-dependent phosphoglycerate mutase
MTEPTAVLYFVRHAESRYAPDEEATRGLTDQGRQQAEQLVGTLEQYGIDVVVSSPYRRAVGTVAPLAEAIGTEVVTEDGFRERELPHVDDFEATAERLWENPAASVEGGESHERAQKRGVDTVKRTVARWSGTEIAVGTHGTLLALILNHYDSSYDYEFWRQMTMPDIYRVEYEGTEPRQIERIDPEAGA